MVDGTGTTTYEYDQLDRLTEQRRHKELNYEYDLANEQTKITYPNGKAVDTRIRQRRTPQKVTDWLKTQPNSPTTRTPTSQRRHFPGDTSDEDTYNYNNTDPDDRSQDEKRQPKRSRHSLYTRNNDEPARKNHYKGLPGEEKPALHLRRKQPADKSRSRTPTNTTLRTTNDHDTETAPTATTPPTKRKKLLKKPPPRHTPTTKSASAPRRARQRTCDNLRL